MYVMLQFVTVCAQVLSWNLQHVYRDGKVLHDEAPNGRLCTVKHHQYHIGPQPHQFTCYSHKIFP